MSDLVPQAKELTKAEQQKAIDRAFDLEREIKASVGQLHRGRWELARQLYEFRELQGWSLLGYETLHEWLAQPELGLKRAEFDTRTRMWRDLVVVKEVPPKALADVEPSRALEVLPAVMKGDVDVKQAIADARSLSVSDVREKYRTDRIEDHGQQPDNSTSLDPGKETLAKCPMCDSLVPESKLPPRVG